MSKNSNPELDKPHSGLLKDLATQLRSEPPSELERIKIEAGTVIVGSNKYWELRCKYLEKYIDPTYTDNERSNCYMLWNILRHRQK